MIYLDNATTTYPKPESVVKSLAEAARYYGGNPGRSGHAMSMRAAEMIYSTRKKAAALFHADPENVVFTLNCTHALNMAIKGAVKPGSHVGFVLPGAQLRLAAGLRAEQNSGSHL